MHHGEYNATPDHTNSGPDRTAVYPHAGAVTAGDVALVGQESCWGFPGSWPGMKAGDFFLLLHHDVVLFNDASFRLLYIVRVLGGAVVDGGHKSVGGGVDHGAEVVVFE